MGHKQLLMHAAPVLHRTCGQSGQAKWCRHSRLLTSSSHLQCPIALTLSLSRPPSLLSRNAAMLG